MKRVSYSDGLTRVPLCSLSTLIMGVGLVFFATVIASVNSVHAEEQERTSVTEVTARKVGDSALEVRIHGGANSAFTSYDLPDPSRVVVDVANAELSQGLLPKFPSDSNVSLKTKKIEGTNPQILRFEFSTGTSVPYTARQDGNDVLVSFDFEKLASPVRKKGRAVKRARRSAKSHSQQATPDSSNPAVTTNASNRKSDDFGFAGYERERISIDFYKMDLHNVFRFLREVSGMNIIVDESVKGTLTLTLDNVPWDFALDVILNLKELQKIERFNTLVIYPKKKEFTWPGGKGGQGGLSFKAEDGNSANVTPQEKLVITQMGQQHSAGMLEAAQLIEKGRAFEQARNPAMAAQTYEQAFAKWPSNGKLARRISTLYLVDLRNNSKALQYAKRAVALNKKDGVSALNAAIAAANMRDMSTAATYFDMSVQGSRPSQEALISYALFREEARQYDQALQILAKHDALYGRSLEAMVARARILDKRGAGAQAVQAYRAILSSGFSLPSDLSRFVRARAGMGN